MKKVLVVEDERQFREILEKKLTSEGFSVVLAEDGQQALDFLDREPVDLILLDLLMPKMDGVEFLYNLKNTSHASIPIIVLTNLTSVSYPYNKINLKDFLVKANTSLEAVVEKIKSALKQ